MTAALTTPLYELHVELGGKLVDFAGYQLPVQYADGIIAEHHHTRSAASLFDVSHMGQVLVTGENAASALEAVLPIDTDLLAVGQQVYTVMLNAAGGVVDDLIVTRLAPHKFLIVLNAARIKADMEHLRQNLRGADLKPWSDRALLALQGPEAVGALGTIIPTVGELSFLRGAFVEYQGASCFVSRSGYTGEDGFEVSLPAELATEFARQLLDLDAVRPAGLGARDTLRLEAGLCLYGQDLDEETSPIEAGLAWVIAKSRRQSGAKAGGFFGAEVVAEQLQSGVTHSRVGLLVEGKAPLRSGEQLFDESGAEIGVITSGGFAPSVGGPIAHARVASAHASVDSLVYAHLRGRQRPARVAKMPFVPNRYHRS